MDGEKVTKKKKTSHGCPFYDHKQLEKFKDLTLVRHKMYNQSYDWNFYLSIDVVCWLSLFGKLTLIVLWLGWLNHVGLHLLTNKLQKFFYKLIL